MRGVRRRSFAGLLILLAVAAAGVMVAIASPRQADVPKGFPQGFFGVGLAEVPSAQEFDRMRSGGVETARFQLYWPEVQPDDSEFDWGVFDEVIGEAARVGIQILPVVNGTPPWLSGDPTTLPVQTPAQRRAWSGFIAAAAARYGPGGRFWRSHPGIPELPVRAWQIWNEPNFFYFAERVSPRDYARLVEAARRGLDRTAPAARLILAGLFGRPPRPGPQARPAASFLSQVYDNVDRQAFDAVALHPYSPSAQQIRPVIEEVRDVMQENGDAGRELWITELGWGSGFGSGFEKGLYGQVAELSTAFSLFERNPGWRVPAVYWFAWQDTGGCDFCDTTGLTRENGTVKPAWLAFREYAERLG